MKTLRGLFKVFVAWAVLALVAPLFGHEEPTHQLIGDVAASYLVSNSPTRPLLTGSLNTLWNALEFGAAQEDDQPLPGFPAGGVIGRYYFHFFPALDFRLPLVATVNSTCTSPQWGLADAPGCKFTCLIAINNTCSSQSVPETNMFRWGQDLNPDTTGAPAQQSIVQVGYVIHLLEDLGSPAHTRDDLHACPWQQLISPAAIDIGPFPLPYCDVFEKRNVGRSVALPVGQPLINTQGFTTPDQFFSAMRDYTSSNYYSNGTVFDSAFFGPNLVTEDLQYFYGDCIPATLQYGHCETNINGFTGVRKIASKGLSYYASCFDTKFKACDNTLAGVDRHVAEEQFDELGPVIAQHVAAFLQFYAPSLSMSILGTGTGKISGFATVLANGAFSNPAPITCQSHCAQLFVQGSQITLTATPDSGSTFNSWGGDCYGGTPTITVTLSSDLNCTATYTSHPLVISGTFSFSANSTINCRGIASQFNLSGSISGYSGSIAGLYTNRNATGSALDAGGLSNLIQNGGEVEIVARGSVNYGGIGCNQTVDSADNEPDFPPSVVLHGTVIPGGTVMVSDFATSVGNYYYPDHYREEYFEEGSYNQAPQGSVTGLLTASGFTLSASTSMLVELLDYDYISGGSTLYTGGGSGTPVTSVTLNFSFK